MRGAEHVEDPHTVSKLRKRRGGVWRKQGTSGLGGPAPLGLELETESYCLFLCCMTLGDLLSLSGSGSTAFSSLSVFRV